MSLKRKRSYDFVGRSGDSSAVQSSPFSTTSDSSSSTQSYLSASRSPSPLISSLPQGISPHPLSARSSDLNGRTRKRVRDNRPERDIIYENTLQKLYAGAQQQQQQQSHQHQHGDYRQQNMRMNSTPNMPFASASSSAATQPQASLHAFWQLPAPATSAPSPFRFSRQPSPPVQDDRCEDCGIDIGDADSMDVDDMAYDHTSAGSTRCQGCGRTICLNCVVEKGGRGQVCSACAIAM